MAPMLFALPCLALGLGMAQPQPVMAETPRGGYLDWVFYDDLPSAERDRISTQCPGSFIDPWTDTGLADDELRVSASQQSGALEGQVRVTGDVQITQAVLRLFGEEAGYDTRTGQISLPQGGVIRQPDLAIATDRATAETQTSQFQLYDARYTLHMANLHGEARNITRNDATYRLDRTWITRCAPGDFGWSLHARSLEVNTDTNIATGTHARLHVGPVPVAYTPYIRLNLNQERSSGFLSPSLTYRSRYDQYRLSSPYYWAIAPNLDNTTTVDWLLGGDAEDTGAPQVAHVSQEWRYLQRQHRGELTVGTYPGWDDPTIDDPEWGLDLSLRSRNSSLEWSLDYKDSNSARYFSEFLGEEFEPTAINRFAIVYETGANTRLDARVEDQAIFGEAAGTGDLKYVERPGLHLRQPVNLTRSWRLQGLADWERRFKAQPDYLNITVTEPRDPYEAYRLRNRLVLSRTDTWGAWTFNQQYTGDHTFYSMPNFATDDLDEHPLEGYNRLLWDTRHRLSYRIGLPQQQTVTPFVQYEYRPLDEQQVGLPLMNSSVDRLRDRNRITLGSRYQVTGEGWVLTSDLQQAVNLTKELLADTGIREDNWTNPQAGPITWNSRIESGELHSLGALLVFEAERPTPETDPDLSFYGRNYEPRRFRLDYTFTPRLGGVSIASDWNLNNDNDDDNPVRTMTVATVVPVSQVVGMFGYAGWEQLEEADDLELEETVIGLEYDGCCWNIQLAGQRIVNSGLEESSDSALFDTIQLNVNLKGLGSVGGRNSLVQRVRDRIPTFGDRLFDTQ